MSAGNTKPFLGKLELVGALSRNRLLPSAEVRQSVSGLKLSVPAIAMAATISGDATNA